MIDTLLLYIVTVWKPFHKVLTIFQRSLDLCTPVTLLSYVKVSSVLTSGPTTDIPSKEKKKRGDRSTANNRDH